MTVTPLGMRADQVLIGGNWISPHGSDTLPLVNPSDGSTLCEIARGTAEDIDAAVSAAEAALNGAWGRATAAERGRILAQIGRLVAEHADELVRLEAIDVGKPLTQARADVTALARYMEFYAGAADKLHGATIPYPPQTENFHYEAELVAVIGTGGKDIPEEEALDHVWGYAIGNDLTRRDLQLKAREQGRPWDLGKGFDLSAPVGPVFPVAQVGHPDKGRISLTVNGEIKQDADLSELIWSIPEMISILSASMELKPGDLIMTGTPAGVGPMQPGDVCKVMVEGLGEITTTIGPRA